MNFKRYVLPSILILTLATGLGIAQTINKAIQLSQDASGAFGVDTNNNVYFPAHILSTGGTPSVSSGATTPTIAGDDFAGTITMNVAATTVTATFSKAFVTTPQCLVSANGTATTSISYTVTTGALAITASGAAGANNVMTYLCTSKS